ncbi:hypothetical protein AB0E78_33225 [Streptomyces sp. NPDC032198]|uniref:hypothetical protein n=1 Tax=Streptomyces sp. NPDC032198 TaxID=3155127 RepID=UPI0033D324C3
MTGSWTYCEEWNNLAEEPMDPLPPEQARVRHASGDLYTAVLIATGAPSPELRVEIRLETGFTAVTFMDNLGRDELHYSFTVMTGALFLETVRIYDYGDSEERGGYADAWRMESYDFTPDGVAVQEVEVGDEVSSENRRGIDMTSNWEPLPQFGAYDSLIRRER